MKQSKIIHSKVAPPPRDNTYWADINEDPTGRTLKTYYNNKWTTITKSIQIQDLPPEITTSEDVQNGIEYSIAAAKAYTDKQISNAGLDQVALNTSAIAVLNGYDKGLSVRAIVQDEVVKQLESDNVSESFDTLREMAEYLSSHPDDVTEMNEAIKSNYDDINTIKDDYLKSTDKIELQDNIDAVNDAITELDSAYRDADSDIITRIVILEDNVIDTNLSSRVQTIENDYLTSLDKEGLTDEINKKINADDVYDKSTIDQKIDDAITGGTVDLSNYYKKPEMDELLSVKADIDTVYSKADVDELISNIDHPQYELPTASADQLGGIKVGDGLSITDGVLSTTVSEEIADIKQAVEENKQSISSMDLTAVTGYVTSVSQADGKVYAKSVDNIPAADITVEDIDDNFQGTSLEDVINELTALWSWEEFS